MTSKEEYLKKYLSGPQTSGDAEKKRKKKEKSNHQVKRSNTGLKILDDDIDLEKCYGGRTRGAGSDMLLRLPNAQNEEAEFEDEKPTVAEFIDERPEKVKQLETYRHGNKWKQLTSSTTVADGSRRNESEKSTKPSSSTGTNLRKTRNDSESDDSPPRGCKERAVVENSNSSHETSINVRNDSQSLSKKGQTSSHSSQSDPSRSSRQFSRRHDSDSDQSPPRIQCDQLQSSKQFNRRHDSDSDQSPPRLQSDKSTTLARKTEKVRRQDFDLSPVRSKRGDDGSDLSPPRGRRDSDSSPPRGRRDSDSSPPRRGAGCGDLSPARQRQEGSDISPPRKRRDSDSSPPRRGVRSKESKDASVSSSKVVLSMKTMSGSSAGLQSARDMAEEARKLRQKEELAFSNLDDEILGRNAATVRRNKHSGKHIDMEAERLAKEESERKKRELEKKYQQWNKGLKQKEEQNANVQEALHEMDKPLARYKDDRDLDEHLKAREHADDPMLAFIKNNKKKKETSSGGPVKPRYKGREPPPNRFNIWPGYRWDGVDRSNGFEKKYFAKISERKVVKEMAHKWSVEEM